MKYGVYVSGRGTRIRKAIEGNSELASKIKVVISDSDKDDELGSFLNDRGISYYLLEFNSFSCKNRNIQFSNKMLEILKEKGVDYCFSFGTHILKGDILNEYQWRIINFHPALLPQFPGINAIDKAVMENARFLGNTAHFIDEGIDTGPIILQNVMLIDDFLANGYDAILDEQVSLLYCIDRLLMENRIEVEDNKVRIIGANYNITHIYPHV